MRTHSRFGIASALREPQYSAAVAVVDARIAPPKGGNIHDRDVSTPWSNWRGHSFLLIYLPGWHGIFYDPFTRRTLELTEKEKRKIFRISFA